MGFLSVGQEDPLEEEMAPHSSILAWKSHGQRSLAGYSPRGCKHSDTTEHQHHHQVYKAKHEQWLSPGNRTMLLSFALSCLLFFSTHISHFKNLRKEEPTCNPFIVVKQWIDPYMVRPPTMAILSFFVYPPFNQSLFHLHLFTWSIFLHICPTTVPGPI